MVAEGVLIDYWGEIASQSITLIAFGHL